MKTEDLILVLANGPRPRGRAAVGRRMGLGLAFSLSGAVLALLVGHGVHPDLRAMLATPVFWAKVALPLAMALAAVRVAVRLSQPGLTVGRAWISLALPLAIVWLVALLVLWIAPPGVRIAMLLGHTWRTCPFNIALLSLPALGAMLWAMRGLAPTRPTLAGAATGLLAGTIGALVYCLRCPEVHVPFWATWYPLGMAVPAVIGGVFGRSVLRW
jgi:hypothetical protein